MASHSVDAAGLDCGTASRANFEWFTGRSKVGSLRLRRVRRLTEHRKPKFNLCAERIPCRPPVPAELPSVLGSRAGRAGAGSADDGDDDDDDDFDDDNATGDADGFS